MQLTPSTILSRKQESGISDEAKWGIEYSKTPPWSMNNPKFMVSYLEEELANLKLKSNYSVHGDAYNEVKVDLKFEDNTNTGDSYVDHQHIKVVVPNWVAALTSLWIGMSMGSLCTYLVLTIK